MSPSGVIAADFNLDGRPDLAVVGDRSNDLHVLVAQPGGAFAPAMHSPFALGGTVATSRAAADFDRNGLPDVTVANFDTNNVSVLLQQFDGTRRGGARHADRRRPAQPPWARPTSTATATRTSRSPCGTVTVRVLRNRSRLPPSAAYAVGCTRARIAVADFNGDGRPDIGRANWGTRRFDPAADRGGRLRRQHAEPGRRPALGHRHRRLQP